MITLLEVLESAGYDILVNEQDAQWFQSKAQEIEELSTKVDDFLEELEYRKAEDE